MTTHKFKVGDVVGVNVSPLSNPTPGACEVTRRLPPTGNSNQYRVKSHTSGQERVVREEEIFRSNP